MGVFAKAAACAALVGLASAQCTVSDGTHTFDLSTVPANDHLNIKQVIAANPTLDGYYTWAVSLCTPQAPAGGKTCDKAATSYVYEYPTGGASCVAAMNMPVAPWSWDAGKNAATRTFNGQGVRAIVDLTCDPNANTLTVNGDAPTKNEANTWIWNLKLKSKAVCGGGPGPNPTPSPGGGHNTGGGSPKDEGGLGGGFWFLLILILAAVFYVGGVVLYNFVRLGKRGKELAPHPEFWTMLPGLFVDGILFTKDGIMAGVAKVRGGGGGGGSGGGYAEV